MLYVKSIVAGIAASILASVIYVLAMLVVFILIPLLIPLAMSRSTGAGGIGAVSVGVGDGPVLLIALAGFAAGSYWQFRRASKAR